MVKGVPVAEPATVRVRGPKSEVLVLQHVRAAAFDVTGLTEGSYSRHLALDKPTGQKIIPDPATQKSVLITTEVVERPFVKMAVAVTGQAKAKAQPAEVDVRLLCPPELLRALRPQQVVPRVNLRSTAPNGSVDRHRSLVITPSA